MEAIEEKKERCLLENEEGFTLVEIIAVLVILGILAAVAIPKYFDLQSDARQKAMDAAMAEAVGRVNGRFGKALLGGSAPNEIDYQAANIGSDMGDFMLTLTSGAGTGSGDIGIRVEGKDGTPLDNVIVTRTITRPGYP